jgi:CRISPR-associated protein Cas2
MRRRYLIAYDIAEDKRRNAVFELLMSNGDHVQYSVFLCELNARELAVVKGELIQIIHHRHDQVILLDMGLAKRDPRDMLQCIGKGYEPRARVQII